MTGLSRKLGFAVLVLGSTFAVLEAAPRQDLKASFDEGVALLKRGRESEALAVFRGILASDPSPTEALELWQSTDNQVWIDLLVKGGEFEQIQRAMFERVNEGRQEREADEETIRPLVEAVVTNEDALDRSRAISEIARNHGEYAAPFLINHLRDSAGSDQRIRAMHALQTIGSPMVLPLVEALRANDEAVRRNAALALGQIGDKRSAPALAAAAATDENQTVRSVAAESLAKVGGGPDALSAYLQLGEDYRNRRESVLRSYQYSDVVWEWTGNGLESRSVRRELYHDELAERAYRRALALDPSSLEARAGLAGALVSQRARLESLAELDQDVSATQEELSSDLVAIHLAGTEALDMALQTALDENDALAGIGLARTLGETSSSAPRALTTALRAQSAALRAEAAIAIGMIAKNHGIDGGNGVIAALGEAVGRDVVQLVTVIDGDQARARALVSALEGAGIAAQAFGTGAEGLAMINRMAGVDLVVIADRLDDITPFQVIDQLQRRAHTAQTPIVVLSSSEDAEELFGDRVAAVAQGAEDLDAIREAMAENMNRDREEADRLAASAAEALAHFAREGEDITSARAALTATLAYRDDAVAVPAMLALGRAGGEDSLAALTSLVADGERSDEAREAAARACAGIFRRGAAPSADEIDALVSVIGGDASPVVQQAAALALGSAPIGDDVRLRLLANIDGSPSN